MKETHKSNKSLSRECQSRQTREQSCPCTMTARWKANGFHSVIQHFRSLLVKIIFNFENFFLKIQYFQSWIISSILVHMPPLLTLGSVVSRVIQNHSHTPLIRQSLCFQINVLGQKDLTSKLSVALGSSTEMTNVILWQLERKGQEKHN